MKRSLVALVAFFALAGCDYDTWDYSAEVTRLAAAELHCDASQLQITPVPDRYGTHTYVVDGCGCTATYECDYNDHDGCSSDRPLLEPADASCR